MGARLIDRDRARRSHALLAVAAALVLAAFVLVVGVSSALAAAPPTAYTGGVADLTATSATLKGSVHPGGQQTSYYFQFGASSAYEAQTAPSPAGSGTQTVHVMAVVTNLLGGGTYHFRVVAVNASGTVYGLDSTFTTKRVPLTFSVAATPARAVFGAPLSVHGTLTGTGAAGHALVLQANPFPYTSGFHTLGAVERANADGTFSFPLAGLTRSTELRVATLGAPSASSRVLLEAVAVGVTLHVRSVGRSGFARLSGTATAAAPGARVILQLLSAGSAPRTVARTVLRRAGSTVSRFSRLLAIRKPGLYRALVLLPPGALVSNHSRAVLVR